jgi:hypothetical protein
MYIGKIVRRQHISAVLSEFYWQARVPSCGEATLASLFVPCAEKAGAVTASAFTMA